MSTRMEYAQQPAGRCLDRMERMVEEIAAAIAQASTRAPMLTRDDAQISGGER